MIWLSTLLISNLLVNRMLRARNMHFFFFFSWEGKKIVVLNYFMAVNLCPGGVKNKAAKFF